MTKKKKKKKRKEADAVAEVETKNQEIAEASEDKEDPSVKLQIELDQAKDNYLRLAAEFDNFRKRSTRQISEVIKNANESLIVELLDVLDSFERALADNNRDDNSESYYTGMKLIYEQLIQLLDRYSVKRFVSLGENFDPNLHEAMLQVESDKYKPDHVAQELQAGYKLGDKVIRHARVAVTSALTPGEKVENDNEAEVKKK